jgi:ABC-type transport system involved in multi-copper enzyme maturation permease subunit
MSSPQVIYACHWLIRDTFRQSMASYVFWVMLAASAVVILFCLSVGVENGGPLVPPDDVGVNIGHPKQERPHLPKKGHITIAFGAWHIELYRDGQQEVHFLLLLLAEWVAGAGGTLLALVWTAGFMPEFLQPANASVLMSKPIPRWVLLVGKYLGVLTFVAFQVAVFIIGTYLALGLRTGFWVSSYLWGIPLLLLQFAAVYSFSVLLAVLTRSTLACVIGSVMFWFLCWGMNYGRHCLLALQAEMPPLHGVLRWFVEAGYWILPKPVDLGMVLRRALNAGDSFATLPELQKVQELGLFYPELSLWTSLLFAIGMIGIAARQLSDTDY